MFTEFFISLLYYDDCYKFYKKSSKKKSKVEGLSKRISWFSKSG